MSNQIPEFPALDMFVGRSSRRPYPGFGGVIEHPGDLLEELRSEAAWVREDPGVEAFPFHKAFKCMTQSDGESMAHFIRGVANMLVEKGVISGELRDRIPRVS